MTRPLTLLLALCVAVSLTAQTVKLSITERGVVVNAGAIGNLTVGPPSIALPGNQDLKPTFTPDGSGGARATYPDGSVLRVAVSERDGTITWHLDQVPADAVAIKLSTHLPINLNRGGRFVLGDKTGEFPASLGDQFLAHGDAGRLDVIHPLGEGLRFATPTVYQQLQDNRKWNWNVFAWIYRYDLRRHPGADSFQFKLSLLAPAAAADGSLAAPRFLVDRYGQSTLKDWPGKVRSDEDLKADIERQKAALGSWQGPALDAFGGLAGSGERFGLKATGFFYATKVAGDRHALVTPEGNLFFQLGVCGISNTDDFTLVKGREQIYEWLPSRGDAHWRTAWRNQRPDWGVFSFQIANWIRKHGKPYSFEEWTGQTVERLRAWGFNSAGAFTPYTDTLRRLRFPVSLTLPNGKSEGVAHLPDRLGAAEVMDPFAPGVEEALDRAYAGAVAPRADDPLIIGWFLGNEQHFENIPRVVLGYKASKVAAKARVIALLREKYGDIARFNAAWEPVTPFASFEEAGEAPLFIRTDAAAADMRDFHRLYLESYYGLVRRVFKRHDPNHLLIGSRWTPGTSNNEDVVRVGGRYLDVVSINYYTYGIEKDFLKKVHDWSGGRPLLLSEWYYPASDRGLVGEKARDQAERGLAYRNYVEQTAATGWVVGSQWFIYSDQAVTGRFFGGFNGEANNTGLVDVTDRPYEPLVEAARETHARVYDVLLGREKPFAYDDPRFTGRGSGATRSVAIHRALPGLRFDGSTTGWPGRPAETIGADRLATGLPNPGLGGDFRLCWDEQALHFLIQVKDPSPGRNTREPRRYWSGDAVELFIGHRNLDEGGVLQYSDRQILLGAGETPGVHVVNHPEAGKECQVLVLKDVSGDGYTLQARIPWTALGFEPRTGQELLFDVAIDNSDDGELRLQQLVWSGTGRNSGDRGSWGRARLVEN